MLRLDLPRTEEGFEGHIGINHLGHFLLTNLLLDAIKRSPSGRIVTVGSVVYETVKEFDFDGLSKTAKTNAQGLKNESYNQSKLANVLFTVALSNRLKGTNVTANIMCVILEWCTL